MTWGSIDTKLNVSELHLARSFQVLHQRRLGAHRDRIPGGHFFGNGEGVETIHRLGDEY